MVIPTTRPFKARFQHTDERSPDGYHFSDKPVMGWTEQGKPLVLDKDGRVLVPASVFTNFYDVVEDEGVFVGALPGGGWRVAWKDGNGNLTDVETVVAWVVNVQGVAEALVVDADGIASCYISQAHTELVPPGAPLPPAVPTDEPPPDIPASGTVKDSPPERGDAPESGAQA